MRPSYHVLISCGVTAVFSIWIKSKLALLACFLSGVFIDIDHHLDYYLARKEFPFSFRKLYDFCVSERRAKMYLVFHSYELITVLWLVIYAFALGDIWIGVAVGMTTHMICDEVGNPLKPMAYFLYYRYQHNFDRRLLIKKSHANRFGED